LSLLTHGAQNTFTAELILGRFFDVLEETVNWSPNPADSMTASFGFFKISFPEKQ
jgi:hypothetical protein